MSGIAAIRHSDVLTPDFTGRRSASTSAVPGSLPSQHSEWFLAYQELFRSMWIEYSYSAPGYLALVTEALPIARHEGPSAALVLLRTIERAFGESASDLSKMLRVSRQMIYHYRQGMEPAIENFRRMKLIADLASHVSDVSLEPILKAPQPEGETLLAFLSENSPNVPLVRRIVVRTSEDLRKRRQLAAALAYATVDERQDIMRARHASGKPVYVSDPNSPGKIVQVRPDQTRVRGRMVNRVFVPDEE